MIRVRTLAALLRRVEAMQIRGRERRWSLIPPEAAKRLRPRMARVGDGLVTLLGASDSLRINRVFGLGHRGRAEEAMIDEIIARYQAARLRRFSFMLSPGPQVQAITGWLLRRGFEPHGAYTLLLRDCRTPIPRAASRVRVAPARRRDAATVADIFSSSFGTPASHRSWMLATAVASGDAVELGFVGATPVAVAALRIEGDLAWLGGGATLTRWRRRGAHGALIASRLRRAARGGCRWAWVETNTPVAGRPDGSRRNMLRFGFEEACIKPIFVWREC